MYIKRSIAPAIKHALKHFPVVLLTGPRQSGKTSLLRHHFADFTYHSLDALDTRLRAQNDPRSFFPDTSPGIIIDEIQESPELLSYVKEFVDRTQSPGQVIITGSHQFELMRGVSESLAGRVAVLELLPFSYAEIAPCGEQELAQLIQRGMYPHVQTHADMNHELWCASYINTYLQRDLRSQIAVRDLRAFGEMLQLLAARVGQELNMHKLGQEVGVNSPTIKSWISALEAAYIIHLVPPYHRNFGKRIIKSPKMYFCDTGLVCHLTKQTSAAAILAGPLAGPLFENFVLTEMLKHDLNQSKRPAIYHWRSHDGLEVDFLRERDTTLEAIECKLTHTITDQHVTNLQRFAHFANDADYTLTAVSQSLRPALSSTIAHIHWREITAP